MPTLQFKGRMKDEPAALKGLDINTKKVQPFQGCDVDFISFLPVVIEILSLRDN